MARSLSELEFPARPEYILKLSHVNRCMGYDASKGCNYAAYDACASKGSLRAQGENIEETNLMLGDAD